MAIVKSKLLKQLSDNYPNYYRKDLEKFLNIFLIEIKNALKRGERVELRSFGIWSTHFQKARNSRNPKTGEIEHDGSKWATIEEIKDIADTEIPIYLLEKALEISKNAK